MKQNYKRAVTAVAAAAVLGGAFYAKGPAAPTVEHKAGEFIVKMHEGKTPADVEAIAKYKISTSKIFSGTMAEKENGPLSRYYIFDPSSDNDGKLEKIMKEVSRDKDVESVELNGYLDMQGFRSNNAAKPNDPMYDKLWGMKAIGAEKVYDMIKSGELKMKRQAVVSVVDTGVDHEHEDLKGIVTPVEPARDGAGHGTHCSGSVAAVTNNGVGVSSLSYDNKFIKIIPFKVLDDSGRGSYETVAEGIVKAADAKVDIISMSLGGRAPTPPQVVKDAVDYALDHKVIIIAAAGNSNDDTKNFTPANIKGVIAVGASSENAKRASFSNWGDIVKVNAPGTNIVSTVPGSKYDSYSGTSMATPHTAGLVGMMKAVNPELTKEQALEILVKTGDEIKQDKGKEIGVRINAPEALKKAAGK